MSDFWERHDFLHFFLIMLMPTGGACLAFAMIYAFSSLVPQH